MALTLFRVEFSPAKLYILKPELFPKEIIENSAESHFSDHNVTSKAIYLSVLFFIVLALASLPFIFVDISVKSNGLIRPITYKNIIAAPISGRVKAIYMEENKTVQENETVLVIETDQIEDQILTNNTRISKIEKFINDLNRLIRTTKFDASTPINTFQTSLYAQSFLHFQQQLHEAGNQYRKVKTEFDRKELLLKEKVIAQIEYDDIEFELNQSLIAINVLEKAQKNKWQMELNGYQEELIELEADNRRLQQEKEKYVIYAPLSGVIQNLSGIYKGSFIHANQQLAEISPDSGLIVECYVTPADIGLLKKGTSARFQIDAFNYNEWGVITGEVVEISNDISISDGQPLFKVRCSLNKDFLELKNGYIGKIKKGMTLQARFLIAERSLFHLLYDNVNDWLNPNQNKIETTSL